MARVLALDLGERRIGVAVSDPTGTVARPVTAIARASRQDDFEAIARLVDEYEAERVVIGLPLSLDGSEGPQARQTRRYAERLGQALDAPIEFWDERYSSVRAEEILREKKGKRRRRQTRGDVDATAAAVFLQSYLDAQAA
ncbi:MAG: Holliday junction resolvase RuvX [Anaerolineae bacterium]|jgi:putative Holliday junction resolvase